MISCGMRDWQIQNGSINMSFIKSQQTYSPMIEGQIQNQPQHTQTTQISQQSQNVHNHDFPTIKLSQPHKQCHTNPQMPIILQQSQNPLSQWSSHADAIQQVCEQQAEKKVQPANFQIYEGNKNVEILVKNKNQLKSQNVPESNVLNPQRAQTEYFSSIYTNNEKIKQEVFMEIKQGQGSDLFVTCRESWKQSKVQEDPNTENTDKEGSPVIANQRKSQLLIDRKSKKQIRESMGGVAISESALKQDRGTCSCSIM